jgi:hypothetical protein
MNTDVIILGCFGVLCLAINKPFGEAFHRANFEFDGKDTGVWPYRGGFIFMGLIFICLAVILFLRG